MIRDVIDFAELEEYIDQPTKTYSTGMNMRLMFAASTMFVPGPPRHRRGAGRRRRLLPGQELRAHPRDSAARKGPTLLLVSHDIYTASTLCERMIWIDHGAVLLDADSPTVLKAYDASIRQQEEARLRKKALLNLEKMAQGNPKLTPVLIELRSPDNTPAPAPVQIGRIALLDGDAEVAAAALVEDHPGSQIKGSLIADGGVWGDVTFWEERTARQMNNYGSSIHKVGTSFLLPERVAARLDELTVAIEAGADRFLSA